MNRQTKPETVSFRFASPPPRGTSRTSTPSPPRHCQISYRGCTRTPSSRSASLTAGTRMNMRVDISRYFKHLSVYEFDKFLKKKNQMEGNREQSNYCLTKNTEDKYDGCLHKSKTGRSAWKLIVTFSPIFKHYFI